MQKWIFLVLSFCFIIGCSNENSDQCEACQLTPEVGLCNAAFPRYYYDQDSMKCKAFIWGGCGGVVPFETLEECKECCEG